MRRTRGFSLLTLAILLPVLVAMLGVSVDLGRIYIFKSELQAFVDAAALGAARELDGTAGGITRAQQIGLIGPSGDGALNRWDFDTQTVPTPVVSFSQVSSGSFVTSPGSGTGYRFVQVAVTATAPIHFLPVLPGISTMQQVSAVAVAGQRSISSLGEGAAPFSPDAHDVADPNFGFTLGTQYTLKWAPPGQRPKPGGSCPGDVGFTPGGGSSDRGYIDIGQGNGNSALGTAIVNNTYSLPQPLVVGSQIDMVQGNKNVAPSIEERFEQDSDRSSTAYATYTGNGRRIFVVPVNDRGDPARVIGFAGFFVPPNACGHNNNDPCCGEYIGPGVLNGQHVGAGYGSGAGLFTITLMR